MSFEECSAHVWSPNSNFLDKIDIFLGGKKRKIKTNLLDQMITFPFLHRIEDELQSIKDEADVGGISNLINLKRDCKIFGILPPPPPPSLLLFSLLLQDPHLFPLFRFHLLLLFLNSSHTSIKISFRLPKKRKKKFE